MLVFSAPSFNLGKWPQYSVQKVALVESACYFKRIKFRTMGEGRINRSSEQNPEIGIESKDIRICERLPIHRIGSKK